MEAQHVLDRQEHLCLACAAQQTYGRHISRLDEIPDEELDTLARAVSLALAHRRLGTQSPSKTLKLLCGNLTPWHRPIALFDLQIAEDLGGERAYINLRDRAYHHGIRLASDMVPTTWVIDSPWVVEHPDWSSARPQPPYPAYSFEGPDLSSDGRVEIKMKTTTWNKPTRLSCFRRAIARVARPATSITATMHKFFPGTILRNSTT